MKDKNVKVKNSDNIPDKRLLNLRPPFKKGEVMPGGGRPKGQRNFATIFKEALAAIAKEDKTTPEKIETDIVKAGLRRAKHDYKFYQDTFDRIHGKPVQKSEISLDGKIEIDDEQKKKSKNAISRILGRRNPR